VSAAVNALFGHRGITHAPFIWAALYAALKLLLGAEWLTYILAFVIGGATHILLDLFNKAGVPLLWPISHRFWIFGIRTDSAAGHAFSFVLACVAVLCTINFFYEAGDYLKEAIWFV
jgi:inner membrane protein